MAKRLLDQAARNVGARSATADHGALSLTRQHRAGRQVLAAAAATIKLTQPGRKARGITINTATLSTKQPSLRPRRLPGHADYVKNMITGAAQDTALVCSADGPMPQTREHILLARQVGRAIHHRVPEQVRHGDDAELLELVEWKCSCSTSTISRRRHPIIHGSLAAEGDKGPLGEEAIAKLADALAPHSPARARHGRRLPDARGRRVLDLCRKVVTGRIERGIVKVGEKSRIVGIADAKTICTGVEMFRA
jgi:elongation factor Tu